MNASLARQQEAFKKSFKAQPILPTTKNYNSLENSCVKDSLQSSTPSDASTGLTGDHAHIQTYRGIAYESAMNAMKNPRHLNSLLHTVLSNLRTAERPLSIQEIFRLTQIDLSKMPQLVAALKANMKISFQNGSFEYRVSR